MINLGHQTASQFRDELKRRGVPQAVVDAAEGMFGDNGRSMFVPVGIHRQHWLVSNDPCDSEDFMLFARSRQGLDGFVCFDSDESAAIRVRYMGGPPIPSCLRDSDTVVEKQDPPHGRKLNMRPAVPESTPLGAPKPERKLNMRPRVASMFEAVARRIERMFR